MAEATAQAPDAGRSVRRSRRRWRLILIGGAAVLATYYLVVAFGLAGRESRTVPLEDGAVARPSDRITLQIDAANLDTDVGAFDLRIQPVPHGSLEADAGGQLRQPLQVELSSPGQAPMSFDFPAEQLVDPVAASIETPAEAHRFPFDRTQVGFQVEARSDGSSVPIDLEMIDDTESWRLSGLIRGDRGDGLSVQVDAERELLAISFALFYIVGTIVVALIAVAVIGGLVNQGYVDFERVIWLGAMLVVIPAVRNEMPGVPAIGTAVDLFIFLPSVAIVAVALVATIARLALNEAAGGATTADSLTTDAATTDAVTADTAATDVE